MKTRKKLHERSQQTSNPERERVFNEMRKQMDYEKKYKEALERAKKYFNPVYPLADKTLVEEIFPELAESEDERIRKWLVELVENQEPKMFIEVKKMDVFAWLEEQKDKNCLACDQHLKGYLAGRKVTEEEKQKERTITSDTEVSISNDYTSAYYEERGYKNGYADGVRDTKAAIAKSPVDKPVEWSEEDERIYKGIFGKIEHDQSYNVSKVDMLNWLKSLRPQK